MEDIKELVHLIKVGSIRPEESYEAPQGGKSRAELERELENISVARERVLALANQLTNDVTYRDGLISSQQELLTKVVAACGDLRKELDGANKEIIFLSGQLEERGFEITRLAKYGGTLETRIQAIQKLAERMFHGGWTLVRMKTVGHLIDVALDASHDMLRKKEKGQK